MEQPDDIVQRVVESLYFFTRWSGGSPDGCDWSESCVATGWWSVAWANLWRTQRCWWLWSGQAIRGDRRCLRWPIATFSTRVRRLLNFEDRSMKLTMPEGLGLLGVLVVGTSLAFG